MFFEPRVGNARAAGCQQCPRRRVHFLSVTSLRSQHQVESGFQSPSALVSLHFYSQPWIRKLKALHDRRAKSNLQPAQPCRLEPCNSKHPPRALRHEPLNLSVPLRTQVFEFRASGCMVGCLTGCFLGRVLWVGGTGFQAFGGFFCHPKTVQPSTQLRKRIEPRNHMQSSTPQSQTAQSRFCKRCPCSKARSYNVQVVYLQQPFITTVPNKPARY